VERRGGGRRREGGGFYEEERSLAFTLAHTAGTVWVTRLYIYAHRGNQLGVAGWAAVEGALERITSLTSLNGCDQYAAIRAGGLEELKLGGTELGVWAGQFLERSASTLTTLDLR
jgi:hypothetical protein